MMTRETAAEVAWRRDPSYYILYGLTVAAWVGAAVALVLWAPWA